MTDFKNLFSVSVGVYILSILILNFGFAFVPLIDLGFGMFSPMAILAGVVFVARDFAQRKAGHWVLAAMAVGVGLSFFLANPFVAMASAAAFAAAEIVDYLVYTITKKPFHQRVLISSIISTPIDTVVFLLGISAFTWGTFLLMILAKLIAAVVIWAIYALDKEPKEIPNPHWDSPTMYR